MRGRNRTRSPISNSERANFGPRNSIAGGLFLTGIPLLITGNISNEPSRRKLNWPLSGRCSARETRLAESLSGEQHGEAGEKKRVTFHL